MYCAGRFRHMASTSRFFSQTCLRGSDRAPHKSIRQTRRCAARVVSRAGRGAKDYEGCQCTVGSGSVGLHSPLSHFPLAQLEMRQAERNRLAQCVGRGQRPVTQSLKKHIAYLERELTMTDTEL